MLKVVTSHQPPLVFVGDNGTSFSGFLVELLPTLLQTATANIQQNITIYAIEGSGGVQLSNGSWTGIMGQLVTGAADMALFPLTLTAQRAPYIQHTQPYMDDGYGILVKIKQLDSGYSFLLPFEGFTWLMVLAALLATILLVSVLDIVTRRARLGAIERTRGINDVKRIRKRDKLMGHVIETVMVAVGSGSAPSTRSCSVKIMFVAWAVFSIIMLSAYTANLTANLTANQLAVNVQSLRDLQQTSAFFGVPGDSSVSAYFSSSSDHIARALRPKMLQFKRHEEGVDEVRQGKIVAYISDYANVLYESQVPPCDLAVGTETVGSGQLVIGLNPNSTLTEQLNTALLQLGESGYLSELRRKWFTDGSGCKDQGDDLDSGSLHMAQAWSVFLILAGGVMLGLVCALLEVVYYRRLFSGVHKLKLELSGLSTMEVLQRRLTGLSHIRLSRLRTNPGKELELLPSVSTDTSKYSSFGPREEHPATAAAAAATAPKPGSSRHFGFLHQDARTGLGHQFRDAKALDVTSIDVQHQHQQEQQQQHHDRQQRKQEVEQQRSAQQQQQQHEQHQQQQQQQPQQPQQQHVQQRHQQLEQQRSVHWQDMQGQDV